jgi:hypothetical protein
VTCDAAAAAAPHSHPHSFSKRAGSRANIIGRRSRGRLCRPGRTCHQKNSGGWGGSRGEGGVGGCMGMQASTNSSPPWSLYPLAMDSYYVAPPPSDMLIPSSTGALPPLPTLLPPRSRPARPLGKYISIPTTPPPTPWAAHLSSLQQGCSCPCHQHLFAGQPSHTGLSTVQLKHQLQRR